LHERFNRLGNSIAKTVREPLINEIQQTRQAMNHLYNEMQQRDALQQQVQATQYWNSTFFAQNEDLRDTPWLVQQAAAQVAREAAANPFQPRTHEQVLKQVADVARTMGRQMGQKFVAPGEGTPPSSADPKQAARRAAMETGGATRVGRTPEQHDFNQKAMSEMFAHFGKGRR
jgi:hypothetical protein